jgi:polysaccharide export outer membrane protein
MTPRQGLAVGVTGDGGRNMLKTLACILVFLVAACASGGGSRSGGVSTVREGGVLSVPDATTSVQSSDFRVAPLDELDIKVFGVETLTGKYQVDPLGQLEMPLIGVVMVKGYSTFDLGRLLEQKLSESYLQNPQVSVRISNSFGQQMTIEGAVGKPGLYPVRGQMSLLQAIAVAGGMTREADPKRVVIFRTIEGKRQGAAFDLEKIRTGAAEDPIVFGNDIIVVDGSNISSDYGDLLRAIPLIGLFVRLF